MSLDGGFMWYREHLGVIRGSDTCVDCCGKDNVKIMLLI